MIKVIGKIPKGDFGLACSGGVDSMAVLDFLIQGGYKPQVIYFNHNTDHGKDAEEFIIEYCDKNNLILHLGRTNLKPKSNKEKVWSDLRYEFFSKFDFPIITCHHLDDSIETYIFSALRGFQSVIPYKRNNVIRPFLLNEKSVFEGWCKRRGVSHIYDESNSSVEYSRNRIRHNIIPEALMINPGLKTVVKKIIKNQNKNL